MIEFWQSIPSRINPVFFTLGPISVRFYGLMFLGAILGSYFVSRWRLKKDHLPYDVNQLDDYYTWVALGAIVGGRLGYAFFYQWNYYSKNLLEIFLPFDFSEGMRFVGISGMSYHGGLIGVFVVSFLFTQKNKIRFWEWVDFIVVSIPAGYTFGRLGNFLNGELWGRVTTLPWGMYFPQDVTGLLRHPSQLYEAFFEGVVVFILLWSLRKKSPRKGSLFCLYLIAYGIVRFLIEYTREPDAHLGLFYNTFSLGQILCLIMILAGSTLFFLLPKKKTS